jgi:3-oxoacyl-[acyl-carrier protein] reductase
MLSLKGKSAIITGASRGIGRATAILFAEAGCSVLVHYRTAEESAADTCRACEKTGVKAIAVRAELSRMVDCQTLVDTVLSEFGHLDILVNNAGIWKRTDIDGMTEAEYRETLDINLGGVFNTIIASVPAMKKQKSGSIINISSTAGQRGEAFHSPYAASKGAIISLTKSLAPELAPHNIRVNCVAPGWVETDMSRDALEKDNEGEIVGAIPLGRVGQPEEIAGPILFLASDMASFITGEIFNVNGGAVLCG